MPIITTAWQFVALVHDPDPENRKRALQVTATEGVWLDVITEFPDLRRAVALNKTVPVSVLRLLAQDEDPDVRNVVARKRKLPNDVLEEMSSDINSGVRLGVVFHPRCPRHVLERLANDDWQEIALKARRRLSESVEKPP